MADFDLTQTDAQVQSILDDAQNAQGAGAQTTLTTDYIMLKDTSGNYHKILKDSFTEACRNVLAGLLVNNDKGTTISQIPAIASGDFGSVTPANLASVLGESQGNASQVIKSSNSDILTLYRDNALTIAGASIKFKNGNTDIGTLSAAVNQSGVSGLTFTRRDNTSYEMNFGCSTASELASLLGVTPISSHTINTGSSVDIEVPIGIIRLSDSSYGTDCGIYAVGTNALVDICKSSTFTDKIVATFVNTSSGKATIRVQNNYTSNRTIYVFLR